MSLLAVMSCLSGMGVVDVPGCHTALNFGGEAKLIAEKSSYVILVTSNP